MNWLLWIPLLLSIGAPSAVLILSLGKDIYPPYLIKRLGIPALALFAVVTAVGLATGDPILNLLVWGAIGGLLSSFALDIVRLIGVKLGAFPLDMPVMFGLMTLGVTPKLPKHVMANMVAALSEMTPEDRGRMLEPRIRAMSQLPPDQRRLFMSMMMNGISKLPQEKKENVLKTNLELISSLAPEQRASMMSTMDQVFGIVQSATPPHGSAAQSPMPIFRAGKMPKVPMSMGRQLLSKAIPDALDEHGTSFGKARVLGYSWHFVNGTTYGIAFALLFGMGSWPLVLAWVTFIDLVMMVSMPPMMPMIRLPFPRFLAVPYVAHLAMAVPIGYFATNYITRSSTISSSLVGSVLVLSGNSYVLLTVLPTVVFVVLTAIIWFGYKVYTKPIYGKGWQ